MLSLREHYPIQAVCDVLGIARSTVYYQPKPREDQPIRDALRELAGQWPTYGYRRLTKMLQRQGYAVNGKRVRGLMHELELAGSPPARKPRTTHSQHGFGRFPNLVADLTIERRDQVWVADITYVQLQEEFVYLAILMDVYTRMIRGWHVSRSLEQELTLVALRRGLSQGRPEIHHSDQGVQYACQAYVELLITTEVAISMAGVGQPEENGYAERVIRTIREEEIALTEYQDLADAREQLGRFLDDVYNTKRIHSSLGYLTPAEFEQQWMATSHEP